MEIDIDEIENLLNEKGYEMLKCHFVEAIHTGDINYIPFAVKCDIRKFGAEHRSTIEVSGMTNEEIVEEFMTYEHYKGNK